MTAFIILIILTPIPPRPVMGLPISVTVNQDGVSLSMDLVLKENLTALPVTNSHISLSNSSDVTQPFLDAINRSIQSRVPAAHVSSFDLTIRTTQIGSTWTVEEVYSLSIAGANTNSGTNIRSNLAFVALNVSQSLRVGSAELNGIGPSYLLPALQAKAANYTNLQYFIDGSQTRNDVIPSGTTQRFWLLDFTWVTPISTWTKVSSTLDQSSHWNLTPANPRFNLTIGLPSPEGTLLVSYVSIFNPSVSLTGPAYAWIDGTTLSFDTPATTETIAPATVLASLILLIATVLFNRRITRTLRRVKKR